MGGGWLDICKECNVCFLLSLKVQPLSYMYFLYPVMTKGKVENGKRNKSKHKYVELEFYFREIC